MEAKLLHVIESRTWNRYLFWLFSWTLGSIWFQLCLSWFLEHWWEHTCSKFLNILICYCILLQVVASRAWYLLFHRFYVLERIVAVDFDSFTVVRHFEVASHPQDVMSAERFLQDIVSLKVILAHTGMLAQFFIPLNEKLTLLRSWLESTLCSRFYRVKLVGGWVLLNLIMARTWSVSLSPQRFILVRHEHWR